MREAEQRQSDAMNSMASYEEIDVDLLLTELRDAPDREAKREAVRRFRRHIIRIVASLR